MPVPARPEDILPDDQNSAEINGVVVRKGTVAAFLANAQTLSALPPGSPDREPIIEQLHTGHTSQHCEVDLMLLNSTPRYPQLSPASATEPAAQATITSCTPVQEGTPAIALLRMTHLVRHLGGPATHNSAPASSQRSISAHCAAAEWMLNARACSSARSWKNSSTEEGIGKVEQDLASPTQLISEDGMTFPV